MTVVIGHSDNWKIARDPIIGIPLIIPDPRTARLAMITIARYSKSIDEYYELLEALGLKDNDL